MNRWVNYYVKITTISLLTTIYNIITVIILSPKILTVNYNNFSSSDGVTTYYASTTDDSIRADIVYMSPYIFL